MRRFGILAVALLAAVSACNRGNDKMDQPLSNDLNLAAQQRPGQDTISAAERNLATPNSAASTVVRRSTGEVSTVRHRSTSTGGYTATTTTTTHSTVVRNTKRDAAIGAAAGAIIGAASSRDKLKGGLIGAAAGGILGGVIGNNVDVKKKP